MITSDIKNFFSFIKPSIFKNWLNVEYVFINYFWFYTLFSLFFWVIKSETLFNVGFPIILLLLVLKNKHKIRVNVFDLLWFLEIMWIIMTWMINDYPHKLYLMYVGLSREMSFMMAYWIARFSNKDYLKSIIYNARKPLIIGCIFGLYFFFFPPEWYIRRVEETLYFFYNGDVSSSLILEQFRLRSFYRSSYAISYMCTMAIICELFYCLKNYSSLGSMKKYLYIYVSVLIIVSILCMMRAPIICWLIGLIIILLYRHIYQSLWGEFLRKLLIAIILIWVLGYFLSLQMDSEIMNFLSSKFSSVIDDKENFVIDRFLLQSQSFTLLGEGFSKYDMMTFYKFGLTSIPDGEYVKIVSEQGFIGLVILLMMFLGGLVKAAVNFKNLYFEFFIIIMLLVCMIGADPLSIPDKHCFIYWLSLGQISRYKLKPIIT